MDRALARLLVLFVRLYQAVFSRIMPSRCRFYPSCSEYAVEALERFGVVRGLWLAGRRILRCHPWHPGGLDLVPADSRAKVRP